MVRTLRTAALAAATMIAATAATDLLLPLYAAPGPGGAAWEPVRAALAASPSVTAHVVVNVDSGPGASSRPPDADWAAGVRALTSLANVRLLGYVRCSRCARDLGTVEAEVAAWSAWTVQGDGGGGGGGGVPAIRGVFFDEAPADGGCVDYMRAVAERARNMTAAGDGLAVFNPGAPAAARSLDPYYALKPALVVALETCFTSQPDAGGADLCGGDDAGPYQPYDAAGGPGSTIDGSLRALVGEGNLARTAVLVHGFHGSNGGAGAAGDAADPATLPAEVAAAAARGIGAVGFVSQQWMTPAEGPADVGSLVAALDKASGGSGKKPSSV